MNESIPDTSETLEERFEQLRRLQGATFAAIDARGPARSPTKRLTRDELHDREALR